MVSKEKKTIKKDNKINWIIGWLVALFVLYLVLSVVFNKIGTFNYEGLTFTKERLGEIPIYHYGYYFESEKYGITKYNLYLRNDPRKNEVPVEGEIGFSKSKIIYLSINGSQLEECEDSAIALASLSSFLSNNDFMIKGASWDEEEAEKNNVRFANCDNRKDSPVILFEKGNESSITKEDNCYIVKVSCESIVKAAEKFELKTILDAKARNP